MADLFDANTNIQQDEQNSNNSYANEFRPKSKDGQGGVWLIDGSETGTVWHGKLTE